MKEHSNCGIGVVANINGVQEHQIIKDGIQILNRLEHRGGVLRDGSGDGAGIMMQIPRDFFKKVAKVSGRYYLAMTFLPKDEEKRNLCRSIIEEEVKEAKLNILATRDVPVKSSVIGNSAKVSMPHIFQYFIEEKDEFFMYSLRRKIEKRIYSHNIEKKEFYFASFSNKTVVYKGLITPKQFKEFYTDLLDPEFKSAFVMIHQRFSTNTLPSWDLAHPFRYLAHNGEINTIAGNKNWIEAKKGDVYSKDYSKEVIEELFPLTSSSNSDSANLDSVIEFMAATGKSLPEILTTLVPQAWEEDTTIEPILRRYYKAKSLVMEPWDGPAGLLSCTGDELFATLDRNGLRPMRYTVTTEDKLIISSEMGVLDTEFSHIKKSGKLSAGEFLYLDFKNKKLLSKDEIINQIVKTTDYDKETENLVTHNKESSSKPSLCKTDTYKNMERFSYTKEDLDISIDFIADTGKEMVTSTTFDIPLAVLDEDNPKLFFDYFRQKFAQVTNPPIDSIREASVFSLTSIYGGKKNLLDYQEDRGNIHMFKSPIISTEQINLLLEDGASLISTEFDEDLEAALISLADKAVELATNKTNIILTDRSTSRSIPVLLAVSTVHHTLVEKGLRNKVGLAVESGEIREINHFALLIGYGADLVSPYLVNDYLINEGRDINSYLQGVDNGIKKIMSKMGISSIASYRGAKIFEAIGLSTDLCNRYLGGTSSSIEGLDLKEIEVELRNREDIKYTIDRNIGEFRSHKNGVSHKDSIDNARKLHYSLKSNSYESYKEYSKEVTDGSYSLRNILELKRNPISIDLVESEEDIMKRFVAGAMSFGALSRKSHQMIAGVFNKVGAMSNSGEGGEDPSRYNSNIVSKVKQIASGRFGVTTNYLMNADELQIKMGQGAKPGEGGHLPGAKVNSEIGKVRNTIAGIDLISPPPHHDIYSIEDLAQLIYDIKNLNTKAKVSVKLASESGVGIIASGTVKAGADKIVISGSEGGTGAAMASSLKYAATPWELGLSDTHKTLTENNLRDLVRVQVDGSIRTGYDIVIGALLGADEYALGTGLLMAQGCIMCRRCHTNTCPVGITTQKKDLQEKFRGSEEELLTYLSFIAREVREILASIGAKNIEDIIGRSSIITKKIVDGYKLSKIDFKNILREVIDTESKTSHKEDIDSLNSALLSNYIDDNPNYKGPINNTNRSFGTTVGGAAELDSFNHHINKNIDIDLNGYAGQSFGAFAIEGQKILLEGYGNDYVAKGLSGGIIAIKTPTNSHDRSGCIAGNTVLYGATSGNLYLNGSTGERFAVRNSGANCVVEGIGNHGCEYMTGGKVVIIGSIGNNFGAGMSGGIAYITADSLENQSVNRDTVEFFEINDADHSYITKELRTHVEYTNSSKARDILDKCIKSSFIKVASRNYLEKTGNISKDNSLDLKQVDEAKEQFKN